MKLPKLFVMVTATFVACAAMVTVHPAYASLSARYEMKVGTTQVAPVKTKVNVDSGKPNVYSKKLSKKFTAVIEKNQREFYTAMINAEMGLRYILSTYKGFKEPSESQFKEMKFAAELLIKDAQSAARRYAQDLRLAKIAMLQMDEHDRTLFAKALGLIFANPAYAAGIDASAMDRVASALDNVANSTPNIDNRSIKDVMKAVQERDAAEASFQNTIAKVYTVGIIGAAATKVTTTAAGMLLGMATSGPFGVAVTLVGGVSATTVAVAELTDEINDAAGTKTKKASESSTIKTLNKVAVVAGAVNMLNSLGELPKNVTSASNGREAVAHIVNSAIDSTQTVISLKDITSTPSDSSDAPGAAGVKAVKEAEKNAGKDSGGGGDGGGHGGGGCGC
ncbi:MAG: hypothetical protein Q4E17_05260 [Synergistes sp.]|nr:hypothetical protein [Synergistes sp.]